MYLDSLSPLRADVGYGQLGTHGKLGYEGKSVQVKRQHYQHALSSHPPARLIFSLGRRFSSFCCQVALNDDVPSGASYADFTVLADGRQVAAATHVVAGSPPCTLQANISGAQLLELVVRTSRWEYCHAVWLDPQLDEAAADTPSTTLLDCLARAEITLPTPVPHAERCIATVVSPGFEGLLDDILDSLYANGGCQDALLVIFALGANAASANALLPNIVPGWCIIYQYQQLSLGDQIRMALTLIVGYRQLGIRSNFGYEITAWRHTC